MKPVYIEMKAFGSYENQKITFDRVDHGLFLITGDTGAGKTTIFDAITYALYGETSGGRRDGRMMRSQFAPEHIKTEVTYCFRYGGERYTVTRSPEQPKYKYNKESGTYEALKTVTPPSASLVLPDGTVYPGRIRDINRKIEEIVGLTCEQFTQVAMLAQGDFLKLLLATSRERKEIFSKIYDTSIYGRISEEIAARFGLAKEALAQNRQEILKELEKVRCVENSSLSDKWEQIPEKFSESRQEELLNLVTEICRECKDVQDRICAFKEENDREISRVQEKLAQTEVLKGLLQDLKKSKEEQKRLSAWISGQQEIQKQLEAEHLKAKQSLEEASPALFTKIHNLENSFGSYDRLEKVTKALAAAEKEAAELEKKLSGHEEELHKEEAQIERLRAETESQKEQMQDREVIELKIERLTLTMQQLTRISQELDELNNVKAALLKAEEAYEDSVREEKARGMEYEKYYRLFIRDQAALLKAELKDGEPCPVCGKIHHEMHGDVDHSAEGLPAPFSGSGEALQHKKEQWEKARQRLTLAYKKKTEWEQKKHGKEENIEKDCRIYLEGFEALDAAVDRRIDSALYHTLEDLEDRKKDQQAVKELEERLKEAKRQEEALKKSCESIQSIVQKEKEALEQRKKEAAEYAVTKKLIQEELPYPLRKEAEQLLGESKAQLDGLKRKSLEAEQAFHKGNQLLQQKKGEYAQCCQHTEEYKKRLELAESRLRGALAENGFMDIMEYVNAQAGEEQLRSLEEKRERLEKQDKEAYHLLHMNREALKKAQALYESREKQKRRYMILSNLNNTANGRLPGKHMSFQVFMQRRFFEQMIGCANKRLYNMSGGQFILQCRELQNLGSQGEVGLDLDVYSLVNDQSRDVKTLSGGESFMAALSMALGMADIIQNSNGRVHIDTMFIDEGFGSLSEETRGQAVAALYELSGNNRLVGIISHVSELKAQVETKLVVTKNEKGSFARWEM